MNVHASTHNAAAQVRDDKVVGPDASMLQLDTGAAPAAEAKQCGVGNRRQQVPNAWAIAKALICVQQESHQDFLCVQIFVSQLRIHAVCNAMFEKSMLGMAKQSA